MYKSVSTTVRVRKETFDECTLLIDSEEFSTFSDLVNYSLRFHLYHILHNEIKTIAYLAGDDYVYQRVRLDGWCREELLSTGLLSKGDLVEYSLSFFLDFRRQFPLKQSKSIETGKDDC